MIKIYTIGTAIEIEYKHFIFNAGEEHVKLLQYFGQDVIIDVVLKCSADIIQLLLITDALRQVNSDVKITLFMPYVPYARQDRVCNKGESLSIKVFSNLINAQKYNKVITIDNHSDVSTAILDNCKNLGVVDWYNPDRVTSIRNDAVERGLSQHHIAVVSPDAGSLKKCISFSKAWGGLEVIRADKIRDTKTGDIIATEVYCDDLQGKSVVIIDDICDGGRTFIEIAKVLQRKNVGDVYLMVTHGIFSQGFGELSKYFKRIYTTNSFYEEDNSMVTRVNVFSKKLNLYI